MPMYDFCCRNDHHFERFFFSNRLHAALEEGIFCEECGEQAKQIFEPSITLSRRPFVPFQPRVVHRKLDESTGRYIYSYPGRSDDPVDHGYERVELNTPSELDRFCRDRALELKEERQFNISAEKDYWDERRKETREKIRAELSRRGLGQSRLFDMVNQYLDSTRDKKYRDQLNHTPEFFNHAASFDQSNMSPYIEDGERRRISVVVNGSKK